VSALLILIPVIPILVLFPFGTSLRQAESFSSKQLCQIVDVLEAVHGIEIEHSDVTASNIFITEEGGIFLSDWGCARYKGEKYYGGAPEWCCSNEILDSFLAKKPPAWNVKNDLICFVRTLFLLIHGGKEEMSCNLDNIKTFWSGLSPNWVAMEVAASKLQYTELRNRVLDLFSLHYNSQRRSLTP